MKNAGLIIVLFVILMLPHWSHADGLGDVRLSLIEGDVLMNTEDTGDWVPASANTPLRPGDGLWTDRDSRAELQLRGATFLRLNEKTSLNILTIEIPSFQFYMAQGEMYINFSGQDNGMLQIDTPVSSVRAYDRSVFGIRVAEDGATTVLVYNGMVTAENRNGATTISGGRLLVMLEDGSLDEQYIGSPDPWEEWNRERDRYLSSVGESGRYLPEELTYYSRDLDDNGRWVLVQDYGYVWTPVGYVSPDWSPYRLGRWVWIAGDYVWISYEPWGWVPYHYGRWIFIETIGWCWVPPARGAVYWGPGFVGWVYTPGYIAWVPLAPGEIYYGYGYYGPYSVNITTVNVNVSQQKIVYRNVYARNGVITVDREGFLKGRIKEMRLRENPFLVHRPSIGRPEIRPEKWTKMPVLRETPQGRRPPTGLARITINELREKRPLARERSHSVFKPGMLREVAPVKRLEQTKGRDVLTPVPKEPALRKSTTPFERLERQPGPRPDTKAMEIKQPRMEHRHAEPGLQQRAPERREKQIEKIAPSPSGQREIKGPVYVPEKQGSHPKKELKKVLKDEKKQEESEK